MFLKIAALALVGLLAVAESKDPNALRSPTRKLQDIAVAENVATSSTPDSSLADSSLPGVGDVGGDVADGYYAFPDEEECRGKSGSCIKKNELCQVMAAATDGIDSCAVFPSFSPEICPCEYEACESDYSAEDTVYYYCKYNFNRCRSDCIDYVSSCCKFPSECCKSKQGCISKEQYCEIFEAADGDSFSCTSFSDFQEEVCPCHYSTETVASYCNRIAPDCTVACESYVTNDLCCPGPSEIPVETTSTPGMTSTPGSPT